VLLRIQNADVKGKLIELKQSQSPDSQPVGEKAVSPAADRQLILILGAFVVVAVIGVIDGLLGYELGMAVFYAIPVAVVSWWVGKNAGVLVSVVSAGAVYLADEMVRPPFVHPLYPVWKAIASLGTLLLIAWLVAARKQDVERREKLMFQLRESAITDERNRMAGEIHDTLAQGFTGISIQLEAAEDILAASPEEALRHIERARDLARESLGEARRSVWALRPSDLDREGLPGALQKFIERISVGAPTQVEFFLQGIPYRLQTEAAFGLLRICQEAVVNALRHAEARHVQVSLRYDPSGVKLCVQDDGLGFDEQAGKTGRGFGLVGMRQRAERIGAQFTISSEPGRGTLVMAAVPASARASKGSLP
jgi:signal transduction histidine kinase